MIFKGLAVLSAFVAAVSAQGCVNYCNEARYSIQQTGGDSYKIGKLGVMGSGKTRTYTMTTVQTDKQAGTPICAQRRCRYFLVQEESNGRFIRHRVKKGEVWSDANMGMTLFSYKSKRRNKRSKKNKKGKKGKKGKKTHKHKHKTYADASSLLQQSSVTKRAVSYLEEANRLGAVQQFYQQNGKKQRLIEFDAVGTTSAGAVLYARHKADSKKHKTHAKHYYSLDEVFLTRGVGDHIYPNNFKGSLYELVHVVNGQSGANNNYILRKIKRSEEWNAGNADAHVYVSKRVKCSNNQCNVPHHHGHKHGSHKYRKHHHHVYHFVQGAGGNFNLFNDKTQQADTTHSYTIAQSTQQFTAGSPMYSNGCDGSLFTIATSSTSTSNDLQLEQVGCGATYQPGAQIYTVYAANV